jgi:PAS domain S-box-containing protein
MTDPSDPRMNMAPMLRATLIKRIDEDGSLDERGLEPGPDDPIIKAVRTRICTSEVPAPRGGIGPAVIAADSQGRGVLMESMAPTWSGRRGVAMGRPSEEVSCMINKYDHQAAESSADRMMIAGDGTEAASQDGTDPVQGREGNIVGVAMASRNASGRREQDLGLRGGEVPYRSMVNPTAAIIRRAPGSGESEANQPGCSTPTGPTLDRLAMRGWLSPVHPDDQPHASALPFGATVSRTGQAVGHRSRQADAEYQHMSVPGQEAAEVRLRESEARSRATEQALRASQDRLMAALSAFGTGTFRWDPETGTFLDFDEGLKRLFGPAAEDPVRIIEDLIPRVHPDDRSKLVPAVDRCRRGKGFETECRVILPDGEIRWLYGRAKMMRDAEGRPTDLVGACTDITQRRRSEEALRDADRRKDEFLTTMSHELRNLLAPIRNAVRALEAKGPTDRESAWATQVIEHQVGQMAHLLDDLLDVSRIVRNKLELRRQRVTLAAVVKDALEISRPPIEAGGHELTVALPAEPVDLDADPVRLAQVFSNLLNNSTKYMDRGGHIRLAARRDENEVLVSIEGTGIGISPEMLPYLFEMFSQASPASERSQGGLGIGLALVKGLVEIHRGTVEARSDGPGRGSEFIVRLPVAVEEVAREAVSRGEVGEPTCVPERRLLIVDDLKVSADSLALMLKVLGHEVQTAYGGEETVAAAAGYRPEAVLLDLGMPKLDGYEACRRIRGQPWGQGMFLIALTGWGQEEAKHRAVAAGFDAHLSKPVDPAALEKLLGAVAARSGDRCRSSPTRGQCGG